MGKQRITKKQKETIFIYRALSVRIFAFIMLLGGIVGLLEPFLKGAVPFSCCQKSLSNLSIASFVFSCVPKDVSRK